MESRKIIELTDEIMLGKLQDTLVDMRALKPEERSEKARRYAVAITEFEKVLAYFKVFVVDYIEWRQNLAPLRSHLCLARPLRSPAHAGRAGAGVRAEGMAVLRGAGGAAAAGESQYIS